MANNAALFFTVAMLMVTAYFLLGSVPLLVLKHDNPVDAKFIRAFYNMYYRLAFVTTLGAAISYALSGRPMFALGAAANAVLVLAQVIGDLHLRVGGDDAECVLQ